MSNPIKTRCFVIKSSDYSETTKIVTLFCAEYGKIRALAKGIKRKKSKLSDVIQNFSLIDATIYLKEHQTLGTISEAFPVCSYQSFGTDMLKFATASVLFEIVEVASPDKAPNRALFSILQYALDDLSATSSNALTTALPYFYRIIKALGYEPEVKQCVLCGRKANLCYFDFSEGGAACSECGARAENRVKITPAIPKIIDKFLTSDIAKANLIKLTASQRRTLLRLAVDFIQYRVERSLKSVRFLESLQG